MSSTATPTPETLTPPDQTETTTTETTSDASKKWKWDRSAQDARKALVEDEDIRYVCEKTIVRAGKDGASITTVLNEVLNEAKNTKIDEFLNLDRTNQRLVVRKILHEKYKSGEYNIVDADSTYRTGKKGKTQHYVTKNPV